MSNVRRIATECFVKVLDTAAAIAAVTGRASLNVVPWREDMEVELPVVAFTFSSIRPRGGVGENYDVVATFGAYATSAKVADDLLKAVEDTLTVPNIIAAGYDAAVLTYFRPDHEHEAEGDQEVVRSDLELGVWFTL